MPRKQHTYHYIYKTTCSVTSRWYIGMHSTSDLEDGYIGSGKRLWLSINKHGRETHTKEILEFLESREALKLREKELVNESLLIDPNCMNLQLGGGGGFSGEENQKKWSSAGGQGLKLKFELDLEFKKNHSIRIKSLNNRFAKQFDWTGLKHSDQTKLKIGKSNSVKQSGKLNSQYGTRWITDLSGFSKKVNKSEIENYLINGWRLGRK